MDGKDLDSVFAEANDTRPVTAKQALGLIAKSLSHVANPETSEGDARDAMARVYAFTKAAHGLIDVEGETDEIAIEKSLVEAVEADGEGARFEPVSRAVGAIRKRFGAPDDGDGNDATDDGKGNDADGGDATGDDADNGGTFDDRGVQWQHDLNADSDPDDDWGRDPSF